MYNSKQRTLRNEVLLILLWVFEVMLSILSENAEITIRALLSKPWLL